MMDDALPAIHDPGHAHAHRHDFRVTLAQHVDLQEHRGQERAAGPVSQRGQALVTVDQRPELHDPQLDGCATEIDADGERIR